MLDLFPKLLIILKFFFKGNSQIINKSKNLGNIIWIVEGLKGDGT